MAEFTPEDLDTQYRKGYEEAETLSIQMASMNKVDIPIFYGTAEDKITAEEYCGLIKNFWLLTHSDKKKRLRQNQMVVRVSLHLRGPAAKWYRNLEKDKDPLVTGYDETNGEKEEGEANKEYLDKFLKAFKKRWQNELNATDKMHLRLILGKNQWKRCSTSMPACGPICGTFWTGQHHLTANRRT